MALKNIGVKYEVVAISEIDKYAIQAYYALHDKNIPNLGDIRKIKVEDIPDHDLFTYSFPCFVARTKIMTDKGYKNIENIEENDMVLTHTNSYKRVVKPMRNKANHLYKIDTMCSETLYTTEEHPFYIRRKYYEYKDECRYSNGKMKKLRKFKEPEWVKAKDLDKECYVGIAINNNWKLPNWNGVDFKWADGRKARKSNILREKFNMSEFWWLIGRYIGDGWIRHQGGIIICCAFDETHEITEKLYKLNFKYCISSERTVNKIHIPFKEIGEYVGQFGRGAENKHLTNDIFDLPTDLLKGFIEGYESADGFVNKHDLHKVSSVSKELVYGLGQCVAKAYKRPFSIYKRKRKPTCMIEGRVVNQKETYTITWKLNKNKQDKAFYDGQYIWCPINKVEKMNYDGYVYNMEVEEDNSYTVNNIIVHNCQDISVAGKTQGIIKGQTRSGLLYECERIIEGKKPKYLLLENVKNLVGKKFKEQFEEWLKYLESLGYTNYWKVLNAKDYGIPQNRERVFVVSILNDTQGYEFPKPIKLEKRIKDILEDEVEEKYYLSEEIQKRFAKFPKNRLNNDSIEVLGTTAPNPYDKDGNLIFDKCTSAWVYNIEKNMSTLSARDYKQPKQIAEEKIDLIQIGKLDIKGMDCIKRVYSVEGACPTLTTMQGGNTQPKILEKISSNQDECYIEYKGKKVELPSKSRIICYNIPQIVNVRKHDVDIAGLKVLLKKYKQFSGLTVQQIAEKLNKSKTLVEHWFRQDDSFSIPNADCWYELKKMLDIEENSFDKSITEFTTKPSNYDMNNRVYDSNGISPTLTTTGEKGTKKIIEYKGKEVELPCIGASRGRNPKNPTSRISGLPTEQHLEINTNGTSNTLTTVQKDNYVVCEQRTDEGLRFFKDNVCGTIRTTNSGGDKRVLEPHEYRIRKLTPRECFRLMGLRDTDIDKIQQTGISNTQQYKMAGNSIVVNVLEEIFRELFIN